MSYLLPQPRHGVSQTGHVSRFFHAACDDHLTTWQSFVSKSVTKWGKYREIELPLSCFLCINPQVLSRRVCILLRRDTCEIKLTREGSFWHSFIPVLPQTMANDRNIVDVQRPANGGEAIDNLAMWRGRNAPNRQEKQKRVLVTGGAGFIGSHLVDRLLEAGHDVIVVDSLFTGKKENFARWRTHPRFEFFRHDVTEPFSAEIDQIYHLACPASPVHYKYNAIKTIKTNVLGTINMLGLAKRTGARFLLASTSEVYGDPEIHPQVEGYWGNVNPIGVRSCYDEGKRVSETLSFDYNRQHGVDIRVVRIFNTYGPRMVLNDGRVVSNFVAQAIRGEPLTIYGDGMQTRSFCYVGDLVDGLVRMMNQTTHNGPINLGNPGEFTMKELAEIVTELVNPGLDVKYLPATPDDPMKRKPDITKAKKYLNWEPTVELRDGLKPMIEDFKERLLGPADSE